jgi:hypothetical protein
MNKFFLFAYFFVYFVSCRPASELDEITYPYKANILILNSLNETQNIFESPHYQMAEVQFSSLTDLKKLDGMYFKFYRGGTIEERNHAIFIRNRSNLNLKYKVIGGVVIPKDYTTLAMLSAYYQFDLLASILKGFLQISIDDMVEKKGKFEVFFEPKFTQENGSLVYTEFPKENAAYIPFFRKFILFSRSQFEHVPLSMNLQVIAHEFGHAVWDFILNSSNSEVCDRLNAEYVLNGLNEGFSDFFSYTITGSTNILYNSFRDTLGSEMRNFSIIKYNYNTILNEKESLFKVCEQNYYCLGSVFAHSLFQAQKLSGYDPKIFLGDKSRSVFLNTIISALAKTRVGMIKYLPPLPQNFDLCSNQNLLDNDYNTKVLTAFFYSFYNQIDDNQIKSAFARAIFENFGIIIRIT